MVYILLADGFEDMEALSPLDVMRRADIDVRTVGIAGTSVTSSHGVTVQADTHAGELSPAKLAENAEMLVLPGGGRGTENLDNSDYVTDCLALCAEKGASLAAICAAPSVLGKRGYLSGKHATCFPGFEQYLDGAEYTGLPVTPPLSALRWWSTCAAKKPPPKSRTPSIRTEPDRGAYDSIMDDKHAEKAALRRKYSALRDSISPEERADSDREMQRRIFGLSEYREAETVMTYVSFGSEPDTMAIIETALSEGKKVACPRCSERPGIMDFYYIASIGDLVPGKYGILEPPPSLKAGTGANTSENRRYGTLCIVPGLCFDRSGLRVGYGGGYYDRVLAGFHGTAVGICYDRCLSDEPLPGERLDRLVGIVVTDKRVLRCTGNTI